LTQETFLKALRGLGKLPPDSNYRAWLYRIATHTHHDWWRAKQRRPIADMDMELLPVQHDIEGDLVRQETLQRLHGLVQQLPPKQRQVLIMARYQDLSYAEIADILSMSMESVRSNLHTAQKKVQHWMEEATL
jgi:RNA polymerase sigma-70 factor (ECF subfamily)